MIRVWLLCGLVAAAAALTTSSVVRPIAIVVAIAAVGVLAYSATRLSREVARERAVGDDLRRLNAELTERIETGQSDLQHSAARLRSIIESAVDAIIVIDERGRVESFNPAAERLFGYSEADVCGRNVSMLMPSPYKEEHDGYLNLYLGDRRRRDHRHRAGSDRDASRRHHVPGRRLVGKSG